ncbi:MAG: FAD synthetase family protein [Treponema sp.]|nr:FAD synthetase family protein [Treponema sp.]
MQQISWDNLPGLEKAGDGKKTALTVGVFDGLHRGHQALIAKITAKAPELLPVVVTFRENPKKFTKTAGKSAKNPRDIIDFKEKIFLMESMGISLCVIIDFSEHFSKMSGRDFLEALNCRLRPAYMALGMNFHCGYRRDTDAGTFKTLAEGLGIEVEIIPPILEWGLPVSSSRIRSALEAGRINEANLLLGRPMV